MGRVIVQLGKDNWHAFHPSEDDMVLEWTIKHYNDVPFRYTVNHIGDGVTQYCLYYISGVLKKIYYTTIGVSEARKLIEETV